MKDFSTDSTRNFVSPRSDVISYYLSYALYRTASLKPIKEKKFQNKGRRRQSAKALKRRTAQL